MHAPDQYIPLVSHRLLFIHINGSFFNVHKFTVQLQLACTYASLFAFDSIVFFQIQVTARTFPTLQSMAPQINALSYKIIVRYLNGKDNTFASDLNTITYIYARVRAPMHI